MLFQALMTIIIFCVLLGGSWLLLGRYFKNVIKIPGKLEKLLNDGKPKRRKRK